MDGRAHNPALRYFAGVALLAGLVFAGLAAWLKSLEHRALSRAVVLERTAAIPDVSLADVARAVTSLKLVTVEVETTASVTVRDQSWRGDVSATVTAPVRLHYGTDLSLLSSEHILVGAPANRYTVTIPPPTRIATDVFSEKETTKIEIGWLRLRSRAGEHALGQARKLLPAQARAMVLRPDDAQLVATKTVEQVEALIEKILNNRATVSVQIEPEHSPDGNPARAVEPDPP